MELQHIETVVKDYIQSGKALRGVATAHRRIIIKTTAVEV
jgi:hypothetical protein